MSKFYTIDDLYQKHTFIYLDAKKSKNFVYLNSEYEPSLEGYILDKDASGVTVRVFTTYTNKNEFLTRLTEEEEPGLEIITNLLIEHTQRLFIPWTSIVAIEV